ncbi:MAG: hypothetical protein IH604_09905 [Burkholderiales bacterium]|nr:hypothetical protein [Burkholderiales bacterium]
MNIGTIGSGSKTHTAILFAYVAIVAALAAYAQHTYEQLKDQRSVPVILPGYAFYILDDSDKGSVVQATGTWRVTNGAIPAIATQTSTIECRKTGMQCVESTAMVSVPEKGFLDAISTVFEIEHWTDAGIVTKPATGRCTTRFVTLDLVNRSVTSVLTEIPGVEKCKEQPGTLKLEGGVKMRK